MAIIYSAYLNLNKIEDIDKILESNFAFTPIKRNQIDSRTEINLFEKGVFISIFPLKRNISINNYQNTFSHIISFRFNTSMDNIEEKLTMLKFIMSPILKSDIVLAFNGEELILAKEKQFFTLWNDTGFWNEHVLPILENTSHTFSDSSSEIDFI